MYKFEKCDIIATYLMGFGRTIMTENTATPISQEQVDFIIADMKRRRLDTNNIPTTVTEGMTAEQWIAQALSSFPSNPYSQAFLQHSIIPSAGIYLNQIKPLITSDFSEMSDAQQANFIRNQMLQNSNHAVKHIAEQVPYAQSVADFSSKIRAEANNSNVRNTFMRDNKHILVPADSPTSYDPAATYATAQYYCSMYLDNVKNYGDYPRRPEPVIEEPVVEKPMPKPLGMATTSKDHRERIDQWMAHLGKADQAQALVDKYGVEVAYKICQQSMLAPAELKDVTGGTSLSSKNAVQYFLNNEVSADNLAKIPGLNAEIVEASLRSVRPEPKIARVEPVGLTPLPGVELKTPQPTAEQISLDEQKVLLAATLKNDLQLANIPQDRVDLAIDMAFARSLESGANNFGEWAFNFRQDLIQNLGGEKAFERNEADYNQLCTTFAEAQTAVATGNVPDDVSARTASFEGMVERNNLHLDLAGMEPSTPILTSETYRQVRRFNNKIERRAEQDAKRAERDAKRAEELGITVEELHQRRDKRKENWNNFVDTINPFNGREH